MKPVLLVTGHLPPDRIAPFAALHERVGLEVALFGGRVHHATANGAGDPAAAPFPVRRVSERAVHSLAASGRHRAIVAGTVGRVALPAAWLGARRARVPFVLWSALWAHPRTPAHLASWPLLRLLYRDADAVATYGPHVSAYVRARGARRVAEAPQPVDVGFWSAPATVDARRAPFQAVFVGRPVPEKGVHVVRAAWELSGLAEPDASLVTVSDASPEQVRNFLGSSDVLVVPSLPTRAFREPWGLVVNEGMLQGTAVITSDAVGAAAGGLVRDGETGVVVRAGDPAALAAALRRLHDAPAERRRLAAAGRRAAAEHTPERWAEGIQRALELAEAAVSLEREP